MKRNPALREQLVDATLGESTSLLVRCALAKELTLAGDFEGAREALVEFWPDVASRPQTRGLDAAAAAELTLRAGVLTGWLGSVNQTNQSQEAAKDLITESLLQFESLGDDAKAAEAQAELAFCYWREGALDDARDLSRSALARLPADADGELRAWVLTRCALIENTALRFNDALRLLDEAAPLLAGSDNHALLGRFHQTLANNLQVLGVAEGRGDYIDRALVEYEATGFHFEQAGDIPNCGRTENNVGYLLQRLGKFREALTHFDRATTIFRELGDGATLAQVEDSRAQCLLAMGHRAEAERVSRRAAAALAHGDEQSLYADALVTHATALARLARREEARAEIERAVEAAEHAGDMAGAGRARLTLIEELADALPAEHLRSTYLLADEALTKTQNPDISARLHRAARRVFEAQLSATPSDSDAAASPDAVTESSEVAATLEGDAARPSRDELSRLFGGRVELTAEAAAALERALSAAEGSAAPLLRAAERTAQRVLRGTAFTVTADAVETVALRLRQEGEGRFDFADPWAEFSLKRETRRFERPFLELALRAAGGRVSHAARLLGLAQAAQLNSLIQTKHPDLTEARAPVIRRRRGIIGKGKRRGRGPSADS